ncbi:uncharacterized protein LOC125493814 [Beta vulgaris subsp. vulgaris]|uniref:uncharacterized protein LOC125493814 n=1 Tax=Beta vulgaris subsp. vulgaris TaxID=3555 RepID=UPI002547ACCE|nr:uncharacterized protein LOC125493814 [Beta vulgaris subsp. vulgaris]
MWDIGCYLRRMQDSAWWHTMRSRELRKGGCAMYTRMWRRKFGNSSIRFMIDPTFAARVFENVRRSGDWNDCREIGCAVAKGFKGVHANRIFGVFVPVLEDRKWWCAAFSVNSEEVWVIDAHRPNSLEHHARPLRNWRLGLIFSSQALKGNGYLGK